jgi:hypothetical protein
MGQVKISAMMATPTLSVNTGIVHRHSPAPFSPSECAMDIIARKTISSQNSTNADRDL